MIRKKRYVPVRKENEFIYETGPVRDRGVSLEGGVELPEERVRVRSGNKGGIPTPIGAKSRKDNKKSYVPLGTERKTSRGELLKKKKKKINAFDLSKNQFNNLLVNVKSGRRISTV